ncbi:thiamine biosynthesis protein ThiC [Thermoanaerobacter mathranii subsp. mathranii str. A3]|uniref:Phosphomethylpyrimidine synthase n=1 Tax=Thermoanaerobacter mathranii subsp. mathranii (strain DSM 11426 / CCUG 53645 / CIP 108742 / A3) TaxID=583358 RepID=A0ABN3Z8B3_THEM3|nr:phosphomethylpyrimidine synthase ThiC [Thermoanaerobacter mathranii]ADH61518.1 thiamine biosynthesis protein ThiC [Thermoanaerobacter mathranii subsp. mathranii str. A3]
MTQLEYALSGIVTKEMKIVAEYEGVDEEFILEGVKKGEIVIPSNVNHKNLIPKGIGKGLMTKVNANIGTSDAYPEIEKEIEKLKVALKAGADAVMDLSTGGDINQSRRKILENSPVPVGTVPMYQAAVESITKYGSIVAMPEEFIFEVIEEQAKDGVDFITVHCGLTSESLKKLKDNGRVMDVASRGGSFTIAWMLHNDKENPLYKHFDRLLDIAKKYDITLSLGDGLRPGCLEDATDAAQIQELIILGELVKRSREAGVQVMVEGPGHVPIDQIEANVKLQKQLCHNAPFYVLGPIVTDIAPGYDHITSAIGGAIAAASGADFLCYVTPAEHLGLPDKEDVKEGVIAAKIAAHAADIAKGIKGAREKDLAMAKARKALEWDEQIKLSIDPDKAFKYRVNKNISTAKTCSMCGKFCAMKIVSEYLGTSAITC